MKKKKIKIVWSCSDYKNHEHKYKYAAYLCGRLQRVLEKLKNGFHISPVVRSNATGWIKVSERLPELDVPVLGIIPGVHYPAYVFRANNADEYLVYYINGVKRCNTVTHWMPLPEPPEV